MCTSLAFIIAVTVRLQGKKVAEKEPFATRLFVAIAIHISQNQSKMFASLLFFSNQKFIVFRCFIEEFNIQNSKFLHNKKKYD